MVWKVLSLWVLKVNKVYWYREIVVVWKFKDFSGDVFCLIKLCGVYVGLVMLIWVGKLMNFSVSILYVGLMVLEMLY